ncbi:hypothetical protein [Agrococcus sp. SGAir0287]|uniref:hypothetical protein n=1 Tax=Agrococcus sp. SGAir0287 TaxID=2070347 RepID=UPI0010F9B2BE|nr:hypothetical protein [Agrococcus sp. SGAir0287]
MSKKAMRAALERRRAQRFDRVRVLLERRSNRGLGREELRELKELLDLLKAEDALARASAGGRKTAKERRADKRARRSVARVTAKPSCAARTLYGAGIRSVVNGGSPGLGRR